MILHNLCRYDSHFIKQEIGEISKKHTSKNKKGEDKQIDTNATPNNMEKYVAFILRKHLIFVDSFQFTSSSLDRLVSNLPNEAFKYTSEVFKHNKFTLIK